MKKKHHLETGTAQGVTGTTQVVAGVPNAMKLPAEVDVRTSAVNTDKLGAWCKKPMKKGQKFGPFAGKITRVVTDDMDSSYVWEIADQKTNKFLFYIDATDARRANWLRYVNCARYLEEQNLVSEQEGTDIFYTTIKDVSVGEELLAWFTPPLLNKKRSSGRQADEAIKAQHGLQNKGKSAIKLSKPSSKKDKVKVKVNGESAKKATHNKVINAPSAVVKEELIEQPVNDTVQLTATKQIKVTSKVAPSVGGGRNKSTSSAVHVNYRRAKTDHKFKLGSSKVAGVVSKSNSKPAESKIEFKSKTGNAGMVRKDLSNGALRKRSAQISETFPVKKKRKIVSELSDKKAGSTVVSKCRNVVPYRDDDSVSNSIDSNHSLSSESSSSSKFFQFGLLPDNIMAVSSGSKLYRCHVCFGVYRHIFSLKRHFIREHVNAKYISPADSHNCLKNSATSKQSDDESDDDVTLTDAVKVGNKSASSKQGGETSSLRVTVSVSPMGKVSGRKVENGDVDSLKHKSEKMKSNVKSSASAQTPKVTDKGSNGSVAPKSNGCGKKASEDDDRDMFKCNLCALTFSLSSSLSGHLKLHLCCDDIDMSSSGSELSPVASSGVVKKKTEAGKMAPPVIEESSDDDGEQDVDDRKKRIVAAETQRNKRKFVCDGCGAGFTVRYSMNRHKLRKSCKANGSEKNILDRQRAAFTFMKSRNKLPLKKTLAAAIVKATSRVATAATVAVRKSSKCRYCHESFGGGRQLRAHRRTKHPEHYFECTTCTAYFHDQLQLDAHLETIHHKFPAKKSDKKPALAAKTGPTAPATSSVKTSPTSSDSARASTSVLSAVGEQRAGTTSPPLITPESSTLVCTTCDRRFQTYAKYIGHCELFHRRQMAADGSRKTLLAKLSQLRDNETPKSLDLSAEIEINHNERFYANVARKVRDNLANFVSGRAGELDANVDTGKKPRRSPSAVKPTRKDTSVSVNAKSAAPPAVDWSVYNLPADYTPYDAEKLLLFARPSSEPMISCPATNSNEVAAKQLQQSGDCGSESDGADKTTTTVATVSPASMKATAGAVIGSSNNGIDAIYSCGKCRRVFGTFVMYQEHMRMRHGDIVERTKELVDSLAYSDVTSSNQSTASGTSAAARVEIDDNNASSTASHQNAEKQAAAAITEMEPFATLRLAMCKTAKNKASVTEPLSISVTSGDCAANGVTRNDSSPQLTVRPHRQLHSPNHSLAPPTLSPMRGGQSLSDSSVAVGTVVSHPPGSLLKHRARFMCRVCHMVLASVDNVEKHEAENHPMVECSFVDVSVGIRPPSCQWSRAFLGLLQVASSVLPPDDPLAGGGSKKCTKCKATVTDLHQHVMQCADPEPIRFYYMYALPTYARRQSTNGKFQKRRVLCRSLVMSRASSASNSSDLGRWSGIDLKVKEKLPRDPARLPYNLRNQLQACELSLMTTSELKCDGCGVWYDTISSLERHIPICAEKEKIREKANLERQSSADDDIEYDPSKFMCIYCVRQFTYLRLLVRHLADSCSVRKKLVSSNEYVDREWEADTLEQFNRFKSAREAQQSKAMSTEDNGFGDFTEQSVKVIRKRGVWWGSRRRVVTPTKRSGTDNSLAASLLDDNSSCSSLSSASQTPDRLFEGKYRATFVAGGEDVASADGRCDNSNDRKTVHSAVCQSELVDSNTATNNECRKQGDDSLVLSGVSEDVCSMHLRSSSLSNSKSSRLNLSPNKLAAHNAVTAEVKPNGISSTSPNMKNPCGGRKKSERSRSCDDDDDGGNSRSQKVTAKRRLSMDTVSQKVDSAASPGKQARSASLVNGCNSSLVQRSPKLKQSSAVRDARTTGGRC